MPAPQMPWDKPKPQPCLSDDEIEKTIDEVVPADLPSEPEEPNEAE